LNFELISEREGEMRKFFAAVLLVGLCLAASNVAGKQTDARRRARELADSFSKSKHEIKEKRGVRVEKFKEVRSEPAMRQNAADYSGEYEADFQYPLSIRVAPGGLVEASGYEPAPHGARRFTLRDARLAGALLTATKVYDDGSTEKFEAVFINRTERNSPSDAGFTEFGLGVVFETPKPADGLQLERLFYRPKR
jgi:hypothetical protein